MWYSRNMLFVFFAFSTKKLLVFWCTMCCPCELLVKLAFNTYENYNFIRSDPRALHPVLIQQTNSFNMFRYDFILFDVIWCYLKRFDDISESLQSFWFQLIPFLAWNCSLVRDFAVMMFLMFVVCCALWNNI